MRILTQTELKQMSQRELITHVLEIQDEHRTCDKTISALVDQCHSLPELTKEIDSLTKIIEALRESHDDVNSKNAHLEDVVTALKRQHAASDAKKLQAELESLQVAHDELSRKHSFCDSQEDAIELLQAEVKEHKQEIKELELIIQGLKVENARIEAAKEEYKKSLPYLNALVEERKRLQDQVADYASRLFVSDEVVGLRYEFKVQQDMRAKCRRIMHDSEPCMGIIFVDNYHHTTGKQNGVKVIELRPNFPAHVAGMRIDDVIERVNNRPIKNKISLISVIEDSLTGDMIPVHIYRAMDNARHVLLITLGARGYSSEQVAVIKRLASIQDSDFEVDLTSEDEQKQIEEARQRLQDQEAPRQSNGQHASSEPHVPKLHLSNIASSSSSSSSSSSFNVHSKYQSHDQHNSFHI